MNNTNRNLTLILVLQIIVIQIFKNSPDFIEHYYSRLFYPFAGRLLRTLFGWIPFSAGDLFYLATGVYLFLLIRKLFIRNTSKKRIFLWKIGAFLSVLYFFFYTFWGLNYFRLPVDKRMELKLSKPQPEALEQLGEQLLLKLIENHSKLTGDRTQKVTTNLQVSEILYETQIGYRQLAKSFPEFSYEPSSIKTSLFSLPLTYMGFSGYLNPFSGEAQVNRRVPKVSLPMISSHEAAHQLGIASENEANFIGFLAAVNHTNPLFRYSAYLMAFRYVLYDLKRLKSPKADSLAKRLPEGVKENIREINAFWEKHQNFSEQYFKLFYDNYLKFNNQKQGIKSYSRVTNLILAYSKSHPLP